MAKYYKATLKVEAWKQHICAACNSTYCYLFRRVKTAQAGTPDAASAALKRVVDKCLETEVDVHPCPVCGVIQPDMVGDRRAAAHKVVLLCLAVGLVALAILGGADVISKALAAPIAGGLGLAALIAHLIISTKNPNRNLEANRQRAQMRIDKGVLRLDGASRRDEPPPESHDLTQTSGHWAALLLLAVGTVSVLAPEIIRGVARWPLNPDWHPEVAGPGDEVWVYLQGEMDTVKGMWNGRPTATVTNAKEVGLAQPQLAASAKQDTWGKRLEVESSEQSTRTRPWVTVKVPDQADLAGQRLTIDMTMDTQYPRMEGPKEFDIAHGVFKDKKDLLLGSPHAGNTYLTAWWLGLLGGGALMLLAGYWLVRQANALRLAAHPTTVFPLRDEPDES